MGELVAILSGKGGTGKTSVCAGIATALAQQGEKVLCIDCDIGLRNLDIALGISELGALSFTEVCSGGYSLEQAAVHPVYPNLSFLTAPLSCTADAVDVDAFGEMLSEAQSRFHYILLSYLPKFWNTGPRTSSRVDSTSSWVAKDISISS